MRSHVVHPRTPPRHRHSKNGPLLCEDNVRCCELRVSLGHQMSDRCNSEKVGPGFQDVHEAPTVGRLPTCKPTTARMPKIVRGFLRVSAIVRSVSARFKELECAELAAFCLQPVRTRVACQPKLVQGREGPTFALCAMVGNLRLDHEWRMVAQIFPRWNPLTSWMRQIEDFQMAA